MPNHTWDKRFLLVELHVVPCRRLPRGLPRGLVHACPAFGPVLHAPFVHTGRTATRAAPKVGGMHHRDEWRIAVQNRPDGDFGKDRASGAMGKAFLRRSGPD